MNLRPALLLLAGAAASRASAQQSPRVTLIDTAVLASPRIPESSGVAASSGRPGVYWTHNDSGDGPLLYAIDSAGRDLGAIRIVGASAVDWEDMAIGPCVRAPGRCVYAGDIGDNYARRGHIVVYRVPEPDVPVSASDTVPATLLDSVVLRYPDQPHDAEALAVSPSGLLLIISKPRVGPPTLFRADARAEVSTLVRVGDLAIDGDLLRGHQVTGAALSPDGRLLVVRTYTSLHFFGFDDDVPTPLTSPNGIAIPVVESQGEAVAFDGPNRLVLTSERGSREHAVVTRLAIHRGQP